MSLMSPFPLRIFNVEFELPTILIAVIVWLAVLNAILWGFIGMGVALNWLWAIA